MESSDLTIETTPIQSDHKMVVCTVTPSKSNMKVVDVTNPKLISQIGAHRILEIMLDERWPREPFITVAQKINLCKQSKTYPDSAHTMVGNMR